MSKIEKALARLRQLPADYSYQELASLLQHLGFEQHNKGNTSGSRVRFYRASDQRIINLHKPHPTKIVNKATLSDVLRALRNAGDLKD